MVKKYLFVLCVVQISSLDSHFLSFQKTEQICTLHCFQKKKNLLHDPLLLSCFFSELFFIRLSFLLFIFWTPLSKLVAPFCSSLVSFFYVSLFFCLFSCLVSFLLFPYFLWTSFFQNRLLSSVSFLSFFGSLFWSLFFLRNNHRCLSSFISFFVVLFLVHHFSFLPQNFSLFFIPFVCFSSWTKNYLFVLHCCMFHFDHFLDTIFCFLSLTLSLFSFFVFSWYSVFVFHMSFYCLCFFSFFLCHFSLSLFSSCSLLSFFSFSFFLFFFDITHFVSSSLFSVRPFSLYLFFLDFRFSVSLLFFSYLLVVIFRFALSPVFIPFFCLFSFFCCFISLLPPLSLSILLSRSLSSSPSSRSPFFVHLLFLELIFLELILRCFGNPLRFFLHLSFG